MLLQRLSEYADQIEHTPELYNWSPVRYIIELSSEGDLLGAEPTDTADPASPRTKRGQPRLVPQIQRTVAVKPLLLADNAEYTLGLPRDQAKSQRTIQAHTAYRDLVSRCGRATGEPAIAAVEAFLAALPAESLRLPEDFDRSALITFRVGDVFPVDQPAVQSFWASANDPSAGDDPADVLQCLVCGQHRPVLERLQAKIKGVPGGQTSGTAIISANAAAFESYGLKASLIAPTCASCGERFTKSANALLKDQAHRIVLGGAAFIFWMRGPDLFSLRDFLTDPQPEQVRDLIASVLSARVQADVDETAFYATVLSGSGGRAVVRDWVDTTVGAVKDHLATWFERQRIVGVAGEEPRPLGLYALATATVREPGDLAPPVLRVLLRAALTGTPAPPGLLYQAVRRNRAEQTVTRPRAALIKLVLWRDDPDRPEGETMVELDPNEASPAYRCGRLLACLEEIQRLAIPGAKATIVDRFFGAASATPASVFGRLLRGSQPHLGKLERDNPGAHNRLQQRLEEILSGLHGFPRILSLEDQGLFALGYYHQRAHDRARARAGAERRRLRAQAPAADQMSESLSQEEEN